MYQKKLEKDIRNAHVPLPAVRLPLNTASSVWSMVLPSRSATPLTNDKFKKENSS